MFFFYLTVNFFLILKFLDNSEFFFNIYALFENYNVFKGHFKMR